MVSDPIVIVGAGVAGLTAAVVLAAAGERVLLLEKDSGPGGKMAAVEVAGRAIDAGPTVLTLAGVFADLPVTLPPMRPATILARHFWSDGARLDLDADPDASAAAVAAFAGVDDAAGFRAFTAAAAAIHATLAGSFLYADRPATPLSLMWRGGFRHLAGFTKLDPYRPLSAMLRDHFTDPRLRQLFGRYTTYCGSSPDCAPATLALIADVERAGVWLVDGGMRSLAAALLAGAVAHGARARFGAAVVGIEVERGRVRGVRLASGERIAAAGVILTADAAALAAGHFGPAAARGRRRFARRDRSYSAFTATFVANPGDAPLLRHNIAFADDATAEFAALAAGLIADDPTVYLCAQDRGATPGDDVPSGRDEAFLLVVNAPADGDAHSYSAAEIDRCMSAISSRLHRSGIPIAIDRSRCSISTPSDFARRFPATGGALYGRASHGWTASFRRPGARTGVRGLYCAGGSVHPGAGVPMAALSAKAAVRALLADRDSTSTYPRAAMPGGMSTRSATADATG